MTFAFCKKSKEMTLIESVPCKQRCRISKKVANKRTQVYPVVVIHIGSNSRVEQMVFFSEKFDWQNVDRSSMTTPKCIFLSVKDFS